MAISEADIITGVMILLIILLLFMIAKGIKKNKTLRTPEQQLFVPITKAEYTNEKINTPTVLTNDDHRPEPMEPVMKNHDIQIINRYTEVRRDWDNVYARHRQRAVFNPLREILMNIRVIPPKRPPGNHQNEVRRDRQQDPEKYIQDMQRDNHHDDNQNVHNSHINMILARKYNRLYELHSNTDLESIAKELDMSISELQEAKITAALQEIEEYGMSNIEENHINRQKLSVVLNEIRKGYSITSVSNAVDEDGNSIAIAEDWILTLAWERIHAPDNADVHETLKQALIDQLIDATHVFRRNALENDLLRVFFGGMLTDAVENSDDPDNFIVRPVCINGRVGRVLSAFTLIDNDPVLREPEKDEKEIANEAYTKAGHILNSELENYDTGNKPIKELYIKDDEDLSEGEQSTVFEFRKHAKEKIVETLKTDYENLIDEKLLLNITQNAISVV